PLRTDQPSGRRDRGVRRLARPRRGARRARLRAGAPHELSSRRRPAMTAIHPRLGLPSLGRRFKGALIEPGAAGWDAASQAFNLTVKQEPDLVAVPADAEDVSTLVCFANTNGLQLAPQRTGHNAEPLGELDGVILVRTDALQGVRIDADRRIARVGAGSKWENVVPQASELGLAA